MNAIDFNLSKSLESNFETGAMCGNDAGIVVFDPGVMGCMVARLSGN